MDVGKGLGSGEEGSHGPSSPLCSQLAFKLTSLTSPASDRFSGVLACHQCLVFTCPKKVS